MTRADHPSGTDRLAEAARKLKLKDNDIVVNVQGDEPLISPRLIARLGIYLVKNRRPACPPLATPSTTRRARNPNVVKVVMDAEGYALYFSRARIPYPREEGAPLRHAGIYGYRVGFLNIYSRLKPAPLRGGSVGAIARALARFPHCSNGQRTEPSGRGYP